MGTHITQQLAQLGNIEVAQDLHSNGLSQPLFLPLLVLDVEADQTD